MKITVDIECSPEEARRLVGLPDLTPVHDLYLDKVKSLIGSGLTADTADTIMRSWVPMGEAGMKLFGQVIGGLANGVKPKSD